MDPLNCQFAHLALFRHLLPFSPNRSQTEGCCPGVHTCHDRIVAAGGERSPGREEEDKFSPANFPIHQRDRRDVRWSPPRTNTKGETPDSVSILICPPFCSHATSSCISPSHADSWAPPSMDQIHVQIARVLQHDYEEVGCHIVYLLILVLRTIELLNSQSTDQTI